jgi:hypothetical protein
MMPPASPSDGTRRDNLLALGPDLPLAVFTSTERWHPERIGALALYCSDGRWGEAFDEFCHRGLLLPRYDRWAVPGGPVCLLPRDSDGGFCRGVWEQLDFLVRAHELRRVVLIAHYGCAYYAELLGRGPDDCLPAQAEDLRTAAEALREWFRGIGVETYLAMRRGGSLSFHQVSP